MKSSRLQTLFFQLAVTVFILLPNVAPTWAQEVVPSNSGVSVDSSVSRQNLALRDEFVGPFTNWVNVKTSYGAVGNGVADDTDAIQRAFNEISTQGFGKTLYIPAGTYRITRTLNIVARENINVFGESPETTTFRWDGANGGTILRNSGVSRSRFGRITFDGASRAGIGLQDIWDGATGNYVTLKEFADLVFKDLSVGMSVGQPHFGDAESVVRRTKFIRCSSSGFFINSFNSLDWWIWDSTFEDNRIGATNDGGAGHFHVYGSVFRRSSYADLSTRNALYFSFRNNFSVGSNTFYAGEGIGANAVQVTLQNNVILDAVNRPIRINNPGPILLLDNTIRSRNGQTTPAVEALSSPATDLISVGNTFTVANPIQANGRFVTLDDRVVERNAVNPVEPTLPNTPVSLNRRVFEVAPGGSEIEIQQAINAAQAFNGQRPIVHLQAGGFTIGSSLIIPAGSDVQLVGDGGFENGTRISWFTPQPSTSPMLILRGPSRATIREINFYGGQFGGTTPILIENADQAGGRIFMDQVDVFGNSQNNLSVEGLDNTLVELHNFGHSGFQPSSPNANSASVRVVGGRRLAAGGSTGGRVNIFGGASSNSILNYDVANNGRLLVEDIWYEGAPTNFLKMSGSGTFTLNGARIANPVDAVNPPMIFENFRGRASLLNINPSGGIAVRGNGTNTNLLVAGALFEQQNNQLVNAVGAQALMLNSRKFVPSSGIVDIANQGTFDAAFLREMLAQVRAEKPSDLTSLPVGVTDVKIFRTSAFSGAYGIRIRAGKSPIFDFDGDGRTDISVFRPSNSTWYILRSTDGFAATQFGISSDKIVPADYDGDGKTDIAVFRNGNWFWLNSSNNTFRSFNYGLTGDVPVPADYSGDGRAELAVYRAGTWFSWNLASNSLNAVQFGLLTDRPVQGDYDGDGRIDQAVYRDGRWHLNRSNLGYTTVDFGLASDKPIVGDYDGDGRADQTVFRGGVWYVLQSSQGIRNWQWGLATDVPFSGDYDGDGKSDVGVYRNGIWYILQSNNAVTSLQFGIAEDKPLANAFVF